MTILFSYYKLRNFVAAALSHPLSSNQDAMDRLSALYFIFIGNNNLWVFTGVFFFFSGVEADGVSVGV